VLLVWQGGEDEELPAGAAETDTMGETP